MKTKLWDWFCRAMLVIAALYLGAHILHYLIG